ncbi:MAG: DUF6134 family protein [Thiohalocapsa sp.]|jgi:hypothetical protein|uniref:DUF6134 family protein n=1 Tax=Thiohalocapsa sp. TaxID=2497641 RepID=UPI0025F9B45A|nr:DUF6134 family protein [Thiohalocapsa sp.]MCG6940094.1 DUF6134 family protein [Thiohalocapsa sp.]
MTPSLANTGLPRAASAALLASVLGAGNAPAAEQLRFQVYLDDRPIGEHRFSIADSGATTRVTSRASFDVDFLFINAYRYRHTSNEVFRNGCLAAIDASTDDNGKRYAVSGESVDGGFRVQGNNGVERADGCLKTFAYWDKDFLSNTRLLNPQTGDLEPVRVQPKGRDTIEVETGRQVPAERYALRTDELTIELWYNDELGWVGLESDTGKGRRIIYRRVL